MPSTNLGKVSVTPKGEWSASAAYEILDIVAKDGSSYLALTSVPSGTALSNTSYWLCIAEKGDKGDTGEISGATASISGGYGTPSVSVTEGGTSTDRSFAFAFSNLVGDGIASISVEKTDTSGAVDTYTMTITMDSGNTDTVTWTVTNGSVTSVNGRTGAVTGLAEEDGYYEEMSVGSADQLISSVYVEDSVPYNFRTSGGSADIGDRDFEDAVVGGSIAWNQQAREISSTYWQASNSTVTITWGTNEATVENVTASWMGISRRGAVSIYKDHIYIVSAEAKILTAGSSVRLGVNLFGNIYLGDSVTTTIYAPLFAVHKAPSDASFSMNIGNRQGTADYAIRNFMLFDLTQMFGSTIADYVYGLEQNTSGAGVAWFKSLFPKPFYAFNSGTLIHVNASAHETTGFNQYDNATGKAQLLGGMQYQITGTYTSLSYSTGETITPNANGKFTPSANGELTVTGGNGTDTCIHLVWDGERDGEYEEYVKHSYALDSDLTLRGIPKLDANNKLYWDGDRYANSGDVARNWREIVFDGSNDERWELSPTYGYYYTSKLTGAIDDNASPNNILCDKITYGTISNTNSTLGICLIWQSIRVRNATMYEDIADWKTYLASNPITVICRLAETTTESADAYTSPQIIDDFGTEWFTVTEQSGVAMPVGHESRYTNNLRAKLEMSPESPASAGDFIVRQVNGVNTYVPLTDKYPSAPSSDGTFYLKCVVSGGSASYTWEEQS